MNTALQIIIIVTAVIMIAFILLQARGATLGAGFGASGELFTTRRGTDKSLFEATIVVTVIFIGALLAGLILA